MITEALMKRNFLVAFLVLAVLVLASCYDYVFIPVEIPTSTPPVTVTEQQVTQTEIQAKNVYNTVIAEVPKLGNSSQWNATKDDGFEYSGTIPDAVTARYGSFEKMFDIDGFVSVGTINEPVETVQLLGREYTIDDTDDISVGNSNFVRDSIFKVENGELNINLFYLYGTLIFGDGIYVNGTRLDEYDGLLDGEYTNVDLDDTGVDFNAFLVGDGYNSTDNKGATVISDGVNDYTVTYKIPRDENVVRPRYEFWTAKAGDIEFVNNSVSGISFDTYNESTASGNKGAYPFGWDTSNKDALVASDRTEHIEYLVIHKDGTITHYEFTLHFIVDYAE